MAAAFVGLVGGGLALVNTAGAPTTTPDAEQAAAPATDAGDQAVVEALAASPLSFEPNLGQAEEGTAFVARGLDYSLSLSPTSATLTSGSAALRMQMVGADPGARVSGRDELDGRINYLVGDDPAAWHTDVATYAQVVHDGVWPGVDLVWHSGQVGELEYDFVVAPGTSPEAVAVNFEGARGLRLDGGDLLIATDSGELRQHAPVLYQDRGGARETVPGSFLLDGTTVRFAVGAYDTTRPLVIDPVLEYSTYLGGPRSPYEDTGNGIAVDAAGAAYVTGKTCSTYFPVSTYAFQRTRRGVCDAFVTKFNPVQGTGVGTGIKYSTFLGGSGSDQGRQIALDGAGNAYVTGLTASSDFPTTAGAYKRTAGGTFVTKLNAKGTKLLYSTRVDGGEAWGFALGPAMAATPAEPTLYVLGLKAGPPPTPGAFQSTCHINNNGLCEDFWLAKINPVGTKGADLVYATYLGGTGRDYRTFLGGLAVDGSGRAYVTGRSDSLDFPMPVASGSFDTSQQRAGCGNNSPCLTGIVAMLDFSLPGDGTGIPSAANQQLVWSTYLDAGDPKGIAIGPGDTVYVTGMPSSKTVEGPDGYTDDYSSAYPTTAGAYNQSFECFGVGCQGFVSKFDPALPADGTGVVSETNQQLVYSTFLRGGANQPIDIAVDATGRAWIAGMTVASSFPVRNAVQPTCGCFYQGHREDGLVVGIDPAGNGDADLVFATFLGGTEPDGVYGIALDGAGSVYVTGVSRSYKNSDGHGKLDRYPVVANNFQMNHPGGNRSDCAVESSRGGCTEAVVSKISGF